MIDILNISFMIYSTKREKHFPMVTGEAPLGVFPIISGNPLKLGIFESFCPHWVPHLPSIKLITMKTMFFLWSLVIASGTVNIYMFILRIIYIYIIVLIIYKQNRSPKIWNSPQICHINARYPECNLQDLQFCNGKTFCNAQW